MITLKEAFEDFHDRLIKQVAETLWNIERVRPMNQKEVEKFQGKGVIKHKLLVDLTLELRERRKNIEVLDEIIKQNGKNGKQN